MWRVAMIASRSTASEVLPRLPSLSFTFITCAGPAPASDPALAPHTRISHRTSDDVRTVSRCVLHCHAPRLTVTSQTKRVGTTPVWDDWDVLLMRANGRFLLLRFHCTYAPMRINTRSNAYASGLTLLTGSARTHTASSFPKAGKSA